MPEKEDHALNVNMRQAYPSIVKAEGIYLYDEERKRFIDGAGGSVVVNAGHGIKEFAQVIKEQVEKVAFAYRMSFTSPQFQQLAKKICELTNFDAVGLKSIEYLKEHNLVDRCARLGEYLARKMEDLMKHPTVGDIRGKGLMRGIEFVADKKTRESLDRGLAYHYQVQSEALDRGLTMLAAGECNKGSAGDMILRPSFYYYRGTN